MPTTSSREGLDNNPAIVFPRKKKGVVVQHPEWVQDLCDLFDNKKSLTDLIGRNKSIADMGTIFSVLQANYLFEQPGFNEHVDTTVVIATCIDSNDLKNLPLEVLNRMERIKKLTGNTVNDIDLNGIPYDFKITYEPSYAKNHIIFMPRIENNFVFENSIKYVFKDLESKIKIINKKQIVSPEDNTIRNYLITLKNKNYIL